MNLDPTTILILKLLAVIVLVALNGFFVAAEFAIVKIRPTRLEQLVRGGDARARIALAMRDLGFTHVWRNEQLPVYDVRGHQLGSIERAAVRTLGLRTRAVHLVGETSDGHFWLQQRALNKANDPGQWDTLMGGLISKHTKTIVLKDRKLFITVDNPALKNELHFSRPKIKEMLNRELKDEIISEVFIY